MAFFHVLKATKERLISELRDSFSKHPIYNKIFIQEKYSFTERPQYAIILQNTSVGKVQLSADNYMGELQSHVVAANIRNIPGQFLEWVKDDTLAIANNGGIMPSPPGLYYIEIVDSTHFAVDPLYVVELEVIIADATGMETSGSMNYEPILPGTLQLYLEGRFDPLLENTDYTVNYSSGFITFINPLPVHTKLVANYKYIGTSLGLFDLHPWKANYKAIPGIILAFGNKFEVGDQQVVVITQDITSVAQVFGGRWDINLNMDCVARDPIQRDEIADECLLQLWVYKKASFERDGIILSDIGMGGENEDLWDETTEEYYYKSSIDFTLQTEWQLAVPMLRTINNINLITGTDSSGGQIYIGNINTMSDSDLQNLSLTIEMLGPDAILEIKNFFSHETIFDYNMLKKLEAYAQTYQSYNPYFPGRSNTLERII
jgi:hypothetical protein